MQFLDVGYTYRAMQERIDSEILSVLKSGHYIGGPAVTDFEKKFASYCGCDHAIGVGNGLDAIILILRALGIGPGDEVIVPANTFIATWLAVSQVGATVVPVDASWDSMNIDVRRIEAVTTPNTRALILVHLYGNPVDPTSIQAHCERHGISIIEDAAQAHGARVADRVVGSLGVASAFSFYPGKNLGAFGDGGAITTSDAKLAEKCRMLSNYGSKEKYVHELAGQNSRLDPIQAVSLSLKLDRLDEWNARRKAIAQRYQAAFAGLDELTVPMIDNAADPVWHLYVIRHRDRDNLSAALKRRGVPTLMHYPVPNHRSEAYLAEFSGASFPITEQICSECLSLPIGPHLSDEDVEAVIDEIVDVLC